jgi:PAS domain S-box-containing protein
MTGSAAFFLQQAEDWLGGDWVSLSLYAGVVLLIILVWAFSSLRKFRGRATLTEEVNRALEWEISERKKADQTLIEQDQRLADFFENAPIGMHRLSSDGRILWANKHELAMLGYAPDEYVGHFIFEFMRPPEAAHELLRRLARNETLRDYPGRLRCKSGAVKDVLIDSNVLWESGSFVHTRTFTRDVTQSKRTLDALRASETRLRLVTEQLPALILTTDENLRITSLMGTGLRALQWDSERYVGRPLCELFKTQDAACPPLAAHQRALEGESMPYEIACGSVVLQGHAEPLRNEAGGIVGSVGIALDISELKNAQQERQHFFGLMSDLFCVASRNGKLKTLNPAWQRVLGISEEALKAQSLLELAHPDDRTTAQKELAKLRAGKLTVTFETRLRCQDGSYRWFSWSAAGALSGDTLYAIGRDITSTKLAEQRLALQYKVTRALAESRTSREVQPRFLELLGSELEFDRARWWADDHVVQEWRRPGSAEVPENECPAKGEVIWDISRAHGATRFCFPVRCGSEILATVELASAAVRPRVEALVEMCVGLGREVGQFMKHRAAEEALRELEERFRLLVEGVTDYSIIMLDPSGHVVSWNSGAERITGFRAEEIVGRSYLALHPPDQTQPGGLEEAARNGRFKDEGWRLRKDGSVFWASIVLTALYDDTGRLRGFSKVMQDLTERRRAERELARSESRYRLLAENASDMIGSYSTEGRVRYISPAVLSILGYTPEEFANRPVFDYIPEEDRPRIQQIYRTAAESPEPQSFTVRYRRKDGIHVWLETTLRTSRNSAEIIGVSRDITQRIEVEQMKNDIISVVSHELRTPLASVRGSLGLLQGGVAGELSAQARQLVGIASNNIDRLTRMINDFLDLKALESGQLKFELKPLAVKELLEKAVESNREFGAQYGVSFELQPDEGAVVLADADRLMQVLTNLLSNAAKFSPAGRPVRVEAARRGRAVRIAVTDRGPGIPEAIRRRIFQKFVQGDPQRKGTGLGLSISKAIVERMGGKIGFETSEGEGTTFFVEFPEHPEIAAKAR